MKKTFLILIVSLLIYVLSYPDIRSQELDSSFQFGVTQYRSGDYDKAVNIMDKIIQIQPDNYYAHYYMAMSLVKLKKFEEAKEHYIKIITNSEDKSLSEYAKKGLNLLDPEFYHKKSNNISIVETGYTDNNVVGLNPNTSSTKSNQPITTNQEQQKMIYNLAQKNKIDPNDLNNLIQLLAKNPSALKTITKLANSNSSVNNTQKFDPAAMAKYIQMMTNKNAMDLIGSFNSNDDEKKNNNDDFMGLMNPMAGMNMMNMNKNSNSTNMETLMNSFMGNQGQNNMNPEMLNQMYLQNMMQNSNTNGF